MINLYNVNKEQEQVNTQTNLPCMLKELSINDSKQIILARYFSPFFDVTLEASGGKACLKRNTVSKTVGNENLL